MVDVAVVEVEVCVPAVDVVLEEGVAHLDSRVPPVWEAQVLGWMGMDE